MTFVTLGDYVVVTDEGKQYKTYEDWAISNRLKNWKRGNSCKNGFYGVVTAISPHGTDKKKVLIAVCNNGHEIIINVAGIEKVKNTSKMNPIKKGMTEAVTRDGRKVTQLTWFEAENAMYTVVGVLDGNIESWNEDGSYTVGEHEQDIFSPVEYEWQWLVRNQLSGQFHTTKFFKTEESLRNSNDKFNSFEWCIISRIEESKREVK